MMGRMARCCMYVLLPRSQRCLSSHRLTACCMAPQVTCAAGACFRLCRTRKEQQEEYYSALADGAVKASTAFSSHGAGRQQVRARLLPLLPFVIMLLKNVETTQADGQLVLRHDANLRHR